MSVRVNEVGNAVSPGLGRPGRPDGWHWWWRRRARRELAAREATELINEFGEDAIWLARICARRSRGALRRHMHAVAAEIERRTGRTSAAPAATGTKAGSPRAAHDQQLTARGPGLPRHDNDHAGAPDDPRHEPSRSRGRHRDAATFAGAGAFDRHREDPDDASDAGAARAERGHGAYFSHGAPMGPHDDEMYDDPPRRSRRSGLAGALALIGCATAGTAGAYGYWSYHFGPDSTQASAAPSQAKPAQPALRGAPPAAASAGGYVVQVSAQRSQAGAHASFRSLQQKFPRQLGGRTAIVRRADLGAQGIYYRAVVGPFASAGEAGELCSSLKAAGGECIIQRN